jgi:hypothetical protein
LLGIFDRSSTAARSRDIQHLGPAHDGVQVWLLKAAARPAPGSWAGRARSGLAAATRGGPLPIAASRMAHLWDALAHAYRVLGFEEAARGCGVRPAGAGADHRANKQAGQRAGAGRDRDQCAVVPGVAARLPVYVKQAWRQRLSAACARHAGLGRASLVLYDVSTLYFETDAGDGFREPGFSKERRLDPQITIGLLTDASGFPLMVSTFEGNKAETKTMLPVVEAFMAAHQLNDVTVVADAGMVSEANQKEIEAAGLSFILGMRIPEVHYVVAQGGCERPGEAAPDGHIFTQPWPAGPRGALPQLAFGSSTI